MFSLSTVAILAFSPNSMTNVSQSQTAVFPAIADLASHNTSLPMNLKPHLQPPHLLLFLFLESLRPTALEMCDGHFYPLGNPMYILLKEKSLHFERTGKNKPFPSREKDT